jgi:hypothetical protein
MVPPLPDLSAYDLLHTPLVSTYKSQEQES